MADDDIDFYEAPELKDFLQLENTVLTGGTFENLEELEPAALPEWTGEPLVVEPLPDPMEEEEKEHLPGACGRPRPDDPKVLFFPFPIRIEAKELFEKTDRQNTYTYIREQLGNNTSLYSIVHCMVRRWVYVLPTEKGGRGKEKAGASGPGLLLWDPLYEYTHALCRNGDNVDAMVDVLRANIANPDTRQFVFLSGTNAAVKLIFQGNFADQFRFNVASLDREMKTLTSEKKIKYTLESLIDRSVNAVDDAVWKLGEDKNIENFLSSYKTDTGTCKNLLEVFRKPTRERVCNLGGNFQFREPLKDTRRQFVSMAVRLARQLAANPVSLAAYNRRVADVREWTGVDERYCDEGTKTTAKKGAARKGQPPTTTTTARQLMQEMPDVDDEGMRVPAGEGPSRKRRTAPMDVEEVDCDGLKQEVLDGEKKLLNGYTYQAAVDVLDRQYSPLSRQLGFYFQGPAIGVDYDHVDLVIKWLWHCGPAYLREVSPKEIEEYFVMHYNHPFSITRGYVEDGWKKRQDES